MRTLLLPILAIFAVGLFAVPGAFADHLVISIDIAEGSSVPGCEETDDGCYILSTVVLSKADKLSWYIRCCHCGSRSLTPMPDPEELKALYAAEYFEQPEDGLPLVGGLRDHSWVLENLPDRGDGLFVDLG